MLKMNKSAVLLRFIFLWCYCTKKPNFIFGISPYSVRMREKRTRKSPNTDTFHAVLPYISLYKICSFPLNIVLVNP